MIRFRHVTYFLKQKIGLNGREGFHIRLTRFSSTTLFMHFNTVRSAPGHIAHIFSCRLGSSRNILMQMFVEAIASFDSVQQSLHYP